MDLHFTADQPDSEEIAAVDGCLAGLHSSDPRRQYLLPVLHALQARKGWVSPGALNYACQRLDVPPAEAFGVADFYAMFRPGPIRRQPCTSATTSPAGSVGPRSSARMSKRCSVPPGRAWMGMQPGTAAPAWASAS